MNMKRLISKEVEDSVVQVIKKGVETGLAESRAGLSSEMTDDFVNQLKSKLQARLDERTLEGVVKIKKEKGSIPL